MLNKFAHQMLRSYRKDPSAVPDWPNDDYDHIFEIEQNQGKPELTFRVEYEHLNGSLSDTCPFPVAGDAWRCRTEAGLVALDVAQRLNFFEETAPPLKQGMMPRNSFVKAAG